MNASVAAPPASAGWHAALALQYRLRGARTVIATRSQSGPLLVQRPFHPEGPRVCHTYLIHPPGGIVGGDRLDLAIGLEEDAHALVTTPSATRWYFSRGRHAHAQQQASLERGATLEWLPQETLLFDGAHARLLTRIALRGDARFLGWEILGLGRPACGETFASGELDFRFEIHRDGAPLLLERLRSRDGHVPGLRGHAACGTLVATGADGVALAAARAACAAVAEPLCGVTLIGDVLVCRALAAHCAPVMALFHRVWGVLRPLLIGVEASEPRIWRT